jgi:hypothetical protein
MTLEISPTFDPPEPKRPDVQIYGEALAAKRNVVALLMRRDRRRQASQWFIAAYAIVATVAAAYGIGNEKVYVYELTQDHAGQKMLLLTDRTYTFRRGEMIDVMRWWTFHTRSITLDPVVNDKFRHGAQMRLADTIRPAFDKHYDATRLSPNWTRDVDLDSFGFTQVTDGQAGFWTFMMAWSETDFFQLQPRAQRRMLGTVTIQVRPPTPPEMAKGSYDGLWIVNFDIQEAPDKGA